MKLKTKIDDTDRDDIVMLQGLVDFVAFLTERPIIIDEAQSLNYFIYHEYCADCKSHHDYCQCDANGPNDDIDYHYDNWVDQQMEKENG